MDAKKLKLFRRKDGRPGIRDEKTNGDPGAGALEVVRCFPWSRPDQYISVRDRKGREICLIRALDEVVDIETRALILDEIGERAFIPEIQRIDYIADEIDLFKWKVQTGSGERIFFTRRREIPREVPGGSVILKDISGDRYIITRLDDLDERSRNWLWLYLD